MAPRIPHVQLVVDTGSTHPTQSDGDVVPLAHYITIASAIPGKAMAMSAASALHRHCSTE